MSQTFFQPLLSQNEKPFRAAQKRSKRDEVSESQLLHFQRANDLSDSREEVKERCPKKRPTLAIPIHFQSEIRRVSVFYSKPFQAAHSQRVLQSSFQITTTQSEC